MVETKVTECSLLRICKSGQCFRMNLMDDGWYEIIAGDRYLRVCQEEDVLMLDCPEEDYLNFWYDYFDLGTDYSAFLDRINPNDHYLVEAAKEADGVRILRQDLWEMMISFLVSQQNNIKRIRKCIEAMCREYGQRCSVDSESSFPGKSYYAFPQPEDLALSDKDELMRTCNLGYRSKYVVQTARSVVNGDIDLKSIKMMPYHRAKKELLSCYGIGEKVADCICLFGLHHLQAFPVDTHIRAALDNHYKRGFPNRRYRDCRGVIQQYIFYHELQQ